MKIRTQFIFTMCLLCSVLIVITVSATITDWVMSKVGQQEAIAAGIVQGASELSYLSQEYLIYHEQYHLGRWQARFDSFSAQVAGLHATRPELSALIAKIQANRKRLKEVFSSLVSTRWGLDGEQGEAINPAGLRVAWSRMAVQTQDLISDATRLSQLLHRRMDQLAETRALLMYTMVALFGIFLLFSYTFTYRRILKSIAALRSGAAVVGSGNLDFIIEEKTNDEIGELTRTFNMMTADLKAVTSSKADLDREIHERKKAYDALRESEARYSDLVRNANSAIIQWRADGTITFFNEYAQAFFGWGAEEAVGRHVGILVPKEESTGADLSGLVRDIVEQPEKYVNNINENVCRDGHRVWMTWTNRPVRDEQGRLTGILAIGSDVTALKQAEAALRNSHARSDLLAKVAQRLLGAENPQIIVEDLCRMVMEHIDCQYFFNYLVDVPGKRMALNAFAGISDEAAERIRKLDLGVAVCGCVARDGKRIVAEHIDSSDDITTQLVKAFGVQAYCCHPLLIEEELLGTLSFGTRTRPVFTQEEISLMKAVADHVALAMHRLLATKALRENEERLRTSLSEKEVLLKEVHHRVKNNMQVISSLVDLQADEVQDPGMHNIFKDVIYRIRSMAMVHEKLYQSADLAHVDFAEYAHSLLGYLWRAQGGIDKGIQLDLKLEPVLLPVNAAVPCGLILNELFGNALTHAFKGRDSGNVTVSLNQNEKGQVCLDVEDNGIGIPKDVDWQKSNSLGLRLVRMLAKQIHAALEAESDHGTRFRLIFEVINS